MNTRYVVSKWYRTDGRRGVYLPYSVHPTWKAAASQVEFLKGRLASLGRYSNERTYIIHEVENFE